MKNMIDIQNLTKRYGKHVALDHVNLSISEGCVFGLIGPDGAGKTTLYQILTTLLSPDEGSATVADLDVVKDYRKLRTKIGYMPEKFSLYPDLTVDENLHFFASLFGVNVKDNFDLIAPIFKISLQSFFTGTGRVPAISTRMRSFFREPPDAHSRSYKSFKTASWACSASFPA